MSLGILSKVKNNSYGLTKILILSDDSGLCIKALNNKPGIYSARLAKRHGSFSKAMKFILEKMKYKKNRSAVFVCSLCLINENRKIYSATGRIKGIISKKILKLHLN